MEHHITANRIRELKQYLKDHPIDPAWDSIAKMRDGVIPDEQLRARVCKSILQKIGEMEKDPPAKCPYPIEEIKRWKQFLKDHPIHSEWNQAVEKSDDNVPWEELVSRSYRELLQEIGEWEE